MKDGTYAIFNVQTGHYTPTPLGECKPSEVDLKDHEEIMVWKNPDNPLLEGHWVQPDPDPTEQEKRDMQIYLHLAAAIELLGIDDD